ncbi:MAG: hypothetical protein V1754_05605 [Pseudomonadota bacterium]
MATLVTEAGTKADDKALKIIAKSLFKELKLNGYDTSQIVSLSTELIGLVTSDIRAEGQEEAAA